MRTYLANVRGMNAAAFSHGVPGSCTGRLVAYGIMRGVDVGNGIT